MPAPDTLPAWRALCEHRRSARKSRAARRALLRSACGIHAELSCALPDRQTLELLLQLAREAGLAERIEALFCGAPVNVSEERPALHPLLRAAEAATPALRETQRRMLDARKRAETLAAQIRRGRRRGFNGARFRDAVHIGVGGSLLGPRLLSEALPARRGGLRCHFLGGIDGEEWEATAAPLAPQTTLFIFASKSGTTRETALNARTARRWLQKAAGKNADLSAHFIAVSANPKAARAWGAPEDAILPVDESVGGRYSLWSAMALTLALRDGDARWRALLQGAAEMDAHFRGAPPERNLPLLLGLLDVWHASLCGYQTQAVVPYAHRLRGLPEFLQQLLMESNGKSVHSDGEPARCATAPALWGGAGSGSEHSFHQLLHQGVGVTPVEFVLVRRSRERRHERRNRELWAHCLAQTQALVSGRSLSEAQRELQRRGRTPKRSRALAPHLAAAGGRPVTLIALDALDAEHLGALLALWEHRVYTAAALWDINCFDQWGVELGKTLGEQTRAALSGKKEAEVSPAVRRWAALYRE